MFNSKAPVFAAVAGFLLSLLTGFVSGVPFPLVFFRASGMSVLWGAIAFGILFLVQKFLPELTSPFSDSGADVDSPGSSVNITIDDPLSDSSSASGGFPSDAPLPDFLSGQKNSSESGILGSAESSPGIEGLPGDSLANQKSGGSASVQEKPAFIPGYPAPPAAQQAAKHSAHRTDGLDELPDLDDFIPAQGVEQEQKDEISSGLGDSSPGGTSSLFSGDDSGSSPGEAVTMAKAIRTILAREP